MIKQCHLKADEKTKNVFLTNFFCGRSHKSIFSTYSFSSVLEVSYRFDQTIQPPRLVSNKVFFLLIIMHNIFYIICKIRKSHFLFQIKLTLYKIIAWIFFLMEQPIHHKKCLNAERNINGWIKSLANFPFHLQFKNLSFEKFRALTVNKIVQKEILLLS